MNLLPLFSKIVLTTGLTIYRIFLCGNGRTYWSKMRKIAEYTVYFRADLRILHSGIFLGARCRRFKSCHSDQKQGLVSQRSSPIFVFVQIPVFDVCYANQILFRLWRMFHSDHFWCFMHKKSSHFRKILTVFCLLCISDALFKIGFSSLKMSPRSMPPVLCAF